jgi:pyoverdine/dityrosine biosynthesis protein Dit1
MPALTLPETTPDVDALASRILRIIHRYGYPNDRQAQKGNSKFIAQIGERIAASEPILMCLPAFPFKSPNTSAKVLGHLPDKAEEFALSHLNGMCAAIEQEYKSGAKLMIISDGLVYNGKPPSDYIIEPCPESAWN